MGLKDLLGQPDDLQRLPARTRAQRLYAMADRAPAGSQERRELNVAAAKAHRLADKQDAAAERRIQARAERGAETRARVKANASRIAQTSRHAVIGKP